PAHLGEARSLLRRPGEAAVAGASRPAPRHDRPRPGMSEGDQEAPLFVQHLRADRHFEAARLAVGPMLVLALPVDATSANEPALALEEGEIAAGGIRAEDHL